MIWVLELYCYHFHYASLVTSHSGEENRSVTETKLYIFLQLKDFILYFQQHCDSRMILTF